MSTTEGLREDITSGAAFAAFLAVGIGALAMGLIVILSEAGLFSVPAVYAPAGAVSGRTTLAVAIWLVAWAVLHSRWKDRVIGGGRVYAATLLLIGVGVVLTFPPVWRLI